MGEVLENGLAGRAVAPPEAETPRLDALTWDLLEEGVVCLDPTGRILRANRAARALWRLAEPLPASLAEAAPAEFRPRLGEMLSEARKGAVACEEADLPGGRCAVRIAPAAGPDGRCLGLVVVAVPPPQPAELDLEQKQLRHRLFQQEKMVVIGEIAAGVAHELNTPLGTILLRAQLLLRQLRDGQAIPDLEVIEREAQRCRRIIDSLLSFSRRSEGAMVTTQMDSLIRECLFLVEKDLALRGIELVYRPADGPDTVCVDPNQIQQVLLNLVTNAVDAVGDDGRIEILMHPAAGAPMLEVQVRDNGCGMTEKVRSQAFSPFFSTKKRGKGTGLGLAICRRIVEDHQGLIELASEAGRGTTVTVRLPQVPLEVDVDA